MVHTPDPNLRNVAIIAHVDHGKTTLVDAMLAYTGSIPRGGEGTECILDSNPLERERGITILAKNCAITYRATSGPRAGESYRINLIDTPGHADFGGEVERVLMMADGVLLLVDASDGPMPQTRFVLSKALSLHLPLIVVVNKCDRTDARPDPVVNEVFDLLVALGVEDDRLDFPIVYASGREGWASTESPVAGGDVRPLFEAIVERLPPPRGDERAPLQMLITSIDYSPYVGRIAMGRVFNGSIRAGQQVAVCAADGETHRGWALKLHRFEGLGRVPAETVTAGDLCAVEGLETFSIGDTVACPEEPRPIARVAVDEPTLHMLLRVNDSPFAGREGRFVTSRQLGERLERELLSNVALRVEPGASPEEFRVSGRGMLHLGILLENMRREGYELAAGQPQVIEKEIDGETCEPIERLSLDVASAGVGPAMELLGQRGAEIMAVQQRGDRMHVEAEIPARGLIGLRGRMMTATSGQAIMHHTFERYAPARAVQQHRLNGVMVATDSGAVTGYALEGLSDRGVMFIKPGDRVYAGQVVGEHTRDNDLPVNVVKGKGLTNMRESNKEATVTLKSPRSLSLEAALEYIEPDELVEITPTSIRLRKRMLDEADRRRAKRDERSRAAAR
jgi:GTP-binding protein